MFLVGVLLGIVSSLLRLIGVPIDSLVGTLFLLLTNNPFMALGYWSTCQGLIMCQTIGELYYTTDKDLDDTSCVQSERRKGNITIYIPDLYRFELFLTIFKCLTLIIISLPWFVYNSTTLKLGINALSIILGIIIILLTINKLINEYKPVERVVYLLTIVGMFILFKLLTGFNIGVFNSIPLLLGISFMDLPSLYRNKDKRKNIRFHQGERSLEFQGTIDWLDISYLGLVFFANLGIGTSKLTNFMSVSKRNDGDVLMNMYAGKHIAAFTSSMLWILLSSNRSALEETVNNVDASLLVNSLGLVLFTITTFYYLSKRFMGFFIDLANSPLNDLQKTICSISILSVLIVFSLVGTSYSLVFLFTFIGLAIGFNVLVNYVNIPNSALSFITFMIPLAGLLF